MHIPKANIHKTLCGVLVALVLATLPLPALANNEIQQTVDSTTSLAAPVSQVLANSQDEPTTTNDIVTPQEPPTVTSIDQSGSISTSTASNQPHLSPDSTVSGRVGNDVNSKATSGEAAIVENETAGDAATGDAAATSTTLNIVNTNGATAGSFQSFECNITENQEANVLIDPLALPGFCQSTIPGTLAQPSASSQNLQSGANLTEILNNIILSATSGNASVKDNEMAGNATSGDAVALANILNIANTTINAKNSFLGIINIYADLKGDILVPQSLVDGLANGSASAQAIGNATTNITNTINASAISGEAAVINNETAGNANSGEATTSLTVLNLTGQQVVAKSSLLVFVNVLGKWLGMIVPAPGSANKSGTAMLGSGVQGNDTSSMVTPASSDTTTNITNIITVGAQSGNVSVAGNEKAGNATSGKAMAGVNLLNITGSNFRLDDWFGALFINVLGSWIGDLDIQANALTSTSPAGSKPGQAVRDVQVYRFETSVDVPTASTVPRTIATAAQPVNQLSSNGFTSVSTPTGAVLGSSVDAAAKDTSPTTSGIKLSTITLGAIILALTTLIATASLSIHRRLTA